MGRLKMLTILLTLVMWGSSANAARPDDTTSSERPGLPAGVKAGDYVKAVAKLYQNGQPDKAALYLKAANDFRDQLSAEDRATLDSFNAKLNATAAAAKAPRDPATMAASVKPLTTGAESSPRDRAVMLVAAARQALSTGQVEEARRLGKEAEALAVPFGLEEDNPARLLADTDRQAAGPLSRIVTGNPKQQASWMLHSAREQMKLGNFDAATQLLNQAKSIDVKWTMFDDTPTKVEAELVKFRPQASQKSPATTSTIRDGDKKQAKARLREAKLALDAGDYQKAESIGLEVASSGANFGMFEESPSKIVSAARALKRRDLARRGQVSGVSRSEEIYTALVKESRDLLQAGKLNEAEARAMQAQQMNVVPSPTADRAETVLHDLAMRKAPVKDAAVTTVAATSSDADEIEQAANNLLAQNQLDAARDKFVEAETVRNQMNTVGSEAPPVALLDMPTNLASMTSASPEKSPADPFDGQAPPAQGAAEPVGIATINPGGGVEDAMAQARSLLSAGNYRAARQAAEQARVGGAGIAAENLLAQIAQTQQQAALSLYEAALDGIRKGEIQRSRLLLSELASSDLDESMQQKIQDLMMKLPRDNSGRIDEKLKSVEDAEAVKAQQLNAEVGTKVAEARRLLETDPQKAIEILEKTKVAVEAAGLSEAVTRTMVRRLDVAVELAKKDKVAFDEKMKDKTYKAEVENKRLRMIEADKQKKERFKAYMDKAQQAQSDNNWVEAEKYAKLAAEIDPNEIAATALATVAKIRRHYEIDQRMKDESSETFLNAMQGVSETGIVASEVMTRGIGYESGFAALTERRRNLADRLAPKKTAKVVEIESTLNKPVTLPNSDQMSLGEAIKYLAEYTGLNIVPDQGALAEEGLTLNSPVNITAVSNMKLKSVLKYMLSPLHLSYSIDSENEVVVITSPQSNRTRMFTKVYSVADLVLSPLNRNRTGASQPNFNPVTGHIDVNGLQAQATAMNGAPLNGQAPTFPAPGSSAPTTFDRPVSFEDFQPLISLIKSSIAPGTWSDDHTPADMGSTYGQGGGGGGGAAGGAPEGVGSIMPFYLNISLIIRQTSEVHDEIVDLLRQLRRLQDLQVSIEVRFIAVGDSFFEQIGVDFDMALHSDAVGKKSSFATINPAALPGGSGGGGGGGGGTTAAQPYLINPIRDHAYGRQPLVVGMGGPTTDINAPTFNPNLMIPFVQNTFDAVAPFNATTGVNSSFGIAFLSDLEVYFFMTAIQGDQRTNVVQAPKVTSFNGAPAFIMSGKQQYYVAQLTPIVGAGAVAFSPTPAAINDGVFLNVTPIVSADRRYVRMTLTPNFTTVEGFATFVVPAAVGGGGIGGASSTINGQIQLPITQTTVLNTTVTVPDGGTVLLGGVKRLREERNEFGVPILSKTPLIDRLFRNVGIGRTTDSLMLMVTPRIIILEEEEERLGIPPIQNVTF